MCTKKEVQIVPKTHHSPETVRILQKSEKVRCICLPSIFHPPREHAQLPKEDNTKFSEFKFVKMFSHFHKESNKICQPKDITKPEIIIEINKAL